MRISMTTGFRCITRHNSAAKLGLSGQTVGWLAMAILLWLSLLTAPVQAAPGDLDTSFNGTGIVSVRANDLAVLSNGRVVVVSEVFPQSLGFTLSQYMTNGQLDTGFGTNGVVQTAILDSATATAVAQQADLKLLVAGNAYTGATSIVALARYLPSGQMDGSFGIGGIVAVPGVANVRVTSMKIQANGSILVAGFLNSLTSVLLRFTSTGQLDPGFGVGGLVNVTHGRAESLAVQADGRILVAGNRFTNPGYDTFLARYSANGAVDPSFGVGGVVTDSPGGLSGGYGGMALAVQADGKILVGSGTGGVAYGLLRYLTDGTLDPAFGSSGRITTSGIDANVVTGIVLQTDGRILAVGGLDRRDSLTNAPPLPVIFPTLVRYLANGHSDTSFASAGQLQLTGMGLSNSQALALQSDGKILIAGAGLVRLLGDPTDATRAIPTLSTGALALLGVLMAFLAGWAARRRMGI